MDLSKFKFVVAPLLGLVLLGTVPLYSQSLYNFVVTDSTVNAWAESSGTLYMGGTFTLAGNRTGTGVPLDSTAGIPIPGFPVVDGYVYAAVPDGSGGWYLGGNFANVGGQPLSRLAHLSSNTSVDTSWNPGADNVVTSWS